MNPTHDVAFLHTADVHVATFSTLVDAAAPGLVARHDVRPELLAAARATGVTPALTLEIRAAMRTAADTGASVVACTCSTIGGAAETAGVDGSFRALRIDRAMADDAVRSGGRILVVAALESTVAPTLELLHGSAASLGTTVDAEVAVVPGAWASFEAGARGEYLDAIVDAVRDRAGEVDVVVLAQASMASAADLCVDVPMRILSSPGPGVDAVVRAFRDRAA